MGSKPCLCIIMSMSLAPHPVGIKFWTSIWRANKDLPYSEIHTRFQNWYGHAFHRSYGKYFFQHRAGPLGTFAPLVVGAVSLKIVSCTTEPCEIWEPLKKRLLHMVKVATSATQHQSEGSREC